MANPQLHGTPFAATASISGSTAIASVTGVSGVVLYVTDISGSTDSSTGTITISSNSTVIWQDKVGSAAPYQHIFSVPLRITSGGSASVTVWGGTVAFANISGYSLP